ncbi:hypothetical protein Trydic_g3158 [Trypoxylus dichotomus]
MKYIFVLCAVFSLIWRTFGLTCYSCNEVNTGNCFNITSANSQSINRCSSGTRFSDIPQIQNIFRDRFADEIETRDTTIQCIEYEQFYYLRNDTQIFRGCVLSEHANIMCSSMATNGYLHYYNLTKCRTCGEDLCNASYRVDPAVFVSLTVALISIRQFYISMLKGCDGWAREQNAIIQTQQESIVRRRTGQKEKRQADEEVVKYSDSGLKSTVCNGVEKSNAE